MRSRRRTTQRRLTIRTRVEVCYGHRVTDAEVSSDPGPDLGGIARPAQLERLLSARRDWPALSPEDLIASPDPMVDRSYLLTFDDGYRDNILELLPILERYRVPATLFITSGFIDRRYVPVERLAGYLIGAARGWLRLPGGREVRLDTLKRRWRMYRWLRRQLRQMSEGTQRYLLLEAMAHENAIELPCATEQDLFLSWKQLRELSHHPLISIGAHTETHPDLRSVRPRLAYREIIRSKRQIEWELSQPVRYFAYPYGAHNSLVRRLVARAGFDLAFSTEKRWVDALMPHHPYRIPRKSLATVCEGLDHD